MGITLKGKVWKQPVGGIVPGDLSSTVADWALENFFVSHSTMFRFVTKASCASGPTFCDRNTTLDQFLEARVLLLHNCPNVSSNGLDKIQTR